MSVANYINTDNHPSHSQSQIPQAAAVEEIKKWRCGKMNNGEQVMALVSPQMKTTGEGVANRLSETEEITPKKCSTKSNSSSTHPRCYKTFFLRLAEESPKRNSDEHSDSSTYDSFNCLETDVCRDSSDTDSNSSYSSEGIGATIKVVEYEVASASNNEDLFTNDSSSGTDDFLFAAFARAICHTSKCSSDFADTEEDSSDTSSDSEFSSADYWVCVKCKNKQNNPMFRYCEKCYQIRKTHFPPRPRLRKSRSAIKRQKSSTDLPFVQRSAMKSEISSGKNKKRKKHAHTDRKDVNSITATSSSSSLQSESIERIVVGISQNQLISTAESSTDDENTAGRFYKDLNSNPIQTNFEETTPYGTHFPNSDRLNKLNEQKSVQHLRMAAKRKIVKAQSNNRALAKRKCYEQKAISSFAPSDTENETDFVLSQSICGSLQGTQKDSGFSSAPSSQEQKSSIEHQNGEHGDCVSNRGNGGESSDTVCDELSDCDVVELSKEKNNISNSLEFDLHSEKHSLDRRVSDILLQSTAEPHAISPLVQSMSECSDAYTNIQPSSSNPELLSISTLKQSKLGSLKTMMAQSSDIYGDFHSYGSCMTCLTEPKNGVFVHSRFLHLCCCYKCAVKIWNKNKKCPICNCAVKNVMKLFVH